MGILSWNHSNILGFQKKVFELSWNRNISIETDDLESSILFYFEADGHDIFSSRNPRMEIRESYINCCSEEQHAAMTEIIQRIDPAHIYR